MVSTLHCTHRVYYISKDALQASYPDFMRVFLRRLWKTGMDSGDCRLWIATSASHPAKVLAGFSAFGSIVDQAGWPTPGRRSSALRRPAAARDAAGVRRIHSPDQNAYRARQSPGWQSQAGAIVKEIPESARSPPFCDTEDQESRNRP